MPKGVLIRHDSLVNVGAMSGETFGILPRTAPPWSRLPASTLPFGKWRWG